MIFRKRQLFHPVLLIVVELVPAQAIYTSYVEWFESGTKREVVESWINDIDLS